MLKLKIESREIRDLKALVAKNPQYYSKAEYGARVDATEKNNKLITDYFYV